jgi:hypothetical protein
VYHCATLQNFTYRVSNLWCHVIYPSEILPSFSPGHLKHQAKPFVCYHLLCHISAGGVTWTFFESPPIQQHFLYNTPVRVFGSSFDYPEGPYDTWGLAWGEAPTDGTPSIQTATLQHDASTGQRRRSKRFLPYMYGGMPGMMGGYGTGMGSAAASAVATNSYGSYGYPFFG